MNESWQKKAANNSDIVIDLQKNVHMKLYPDSILSRWIYCGEFEKTEIAFLKRFLKRGDVFIDIGANIGLYTLIAASIVGHDGSVYSFEPNQKTFGRLIENVSLNGLNNVSCWRLAVSDRPGKLPMKYVLDGFDAWSSLASPTAGTEFVMEGVDCITLDDFLADKRLIGKVTMIKIDVEGWESSVLAGASQTLSGEHAPLLQVEFADQACLSAGRTCKTLYQTLVDFGYDLFTFDLKLNVLIPDPPRDAYPCVNLIAAKPHSLRRKD